MMVPYAARSAGAACMLLAPTRLYARRVRAARTLRERTEEAGSDARDMRERG